MTRRWQTATWARAIAGLAATAVLAGCAGGDAPSAAVTTTPTAPAPAAAPIVHSTEVPALHPSVDDYPAVLLRIETADGVEHRLAVLEAADSPRRRHGLMEVPELPDGTGMWFAFPDEQGPDHGFWMAGTLVPLSIAYVGADGRIVAMLEMEPCDTADCPVYPPGAPYVAALEVPQGWFAGQGIAPGDTIERLGPA